jgi:hypothetical protein
MITSELIQENYSDHVYICVLGVDFASFYDFAIIFWSCSNNVVLFVFHFILKRGNVRFATEVAVLYLQ